VLAAAGYTAEVVAEPQRLHRFLVGTGATAATGLDERLTAIVALFALGDRLPLAQARRALAPVDLEEIEPTGLLTLEDDCAIPNYRLVPHERLLIAGDARGDAGANIVTAFTGPTVKLARLMPRARVRSMLDVGTGSGILALLGAEHCERVTALDLNPRALEFARFNADLNEIMNVELVEGSWLEPVARRRFDLIVINPPYVVSPDYELAYRDSGLPGTALLERLIADAAEHLEEGGIAIMLCSWPHESEEDWASVPTAAAATTGCDALIVSHSTEDPLEYAVRWNTPPVSFAAPGEIRETVARWVEHYRAIGAGAITYGEVILRRRPTGVPRVRAFRAGSEPGERASEQLARALVGQDLADDLDDRALLSRHFSLPEGTDISQRFQRRDGRFVARPAMVRLDRGLGVSAAVDPDALDVVFACDGQRTLSEGVDRAVERRGASASHATAEAAVAAVRELLAHGLLEA
jgi:SAM-dependent methyltransferase